MRRRAVAPRVRTGSASGCAVAALAARIGVGSIFVAQGWRKCLSAEDVPHGRLALQKTLEAHGWPAADRLAVATGVTELVCGTSVFVGWLPRAAVVPLLGILGVAIGQVKRGQGFIGGWDWPYSVAVSAITVLALGGGRISVQGIWRAARMGATAPNISGRAGMMNCRAACVPPRSPAEGPRGSAL